MVLAPEFLEEIKDRVALSDVVSRHVTWDKHRSNSARGDFWAPCPFHHEKTPSFHVDDRKGFYKCFGCDAKGNAISFLREIEGLPFRDAVAKLAAMAGMEMPAEDPADKARAARKRALSDVTEAANAYFRLCLSQNQGADARAELDRRGLDAAAIERFEIGYAPADKSALIRQLGEKGVTAEEMERAGLTARSDHGGAPYPRMRDRIIFPIRDGRGTCIGFGGRAMSDEARAKYLNSPETELFDKGRALYNIGPAREAVAKGGALIVAEGYMDVIALTRAGLSGSVAPLGTAVTETQLEMLWRISPEPVIALDGDKAGRRAAQRLAALALPKLAPGRSLGFCWFPDGQDPDDVLRHHGAAALRAALASPIALVDMLWQSALEAARLDTPERRADFERGLLDQAAQIQHPGVKDQYTREFRNRLRQHFWNLQRQNRTGGRGRTGPVRAPSPAILGKPRPLGEALMLAIMMQHRPLAEDYAEELATLSFRDGDYDRLRQGLLASLAREGDHDWQDELQDLKKGFGLALPPGLRKGDDVDMARLVLAAEFDKWRALQALAPEIDEAASMICQDADDAEERTKDPSAYRLERAKQRLWRSYASRSETESDVVVAKNGAKIDPKEQQALDSLLSEITLKNTPGKR